MGTKRTVALLYLMNLGLLTSVQSALAEEVQVQNCEQSLREFVKQHGTANPDYPRQLTILAGIYLKYGMREKADKTFDQAISAQRTFRNPDVVIPEMMQIWASELALHDLPKAKKVLLDGMAVANRLSFGARERLEYMYGMIRFYDQFGTPDEEQKQIALLDEQLAAIEKAKGLPEAEIGTVAGILTQMSNLFCAPPPTFFNGVTGQVIIQNPKRDSVQKLDFKKAESYQLRAIAQYDKLSKERRVAAHISLRHWYQYFGEKEKADNETRVLDQISNGIDWRELAKPKPRLECHGCGMG